MRSSGRTRRKETPILNAFILIAAAGTSPAQPVEKAGYGPVRSLSDVALERRLGIKGVEGGTFSVTGAEGMPVLLFPVYGPGGSFEEADRADGAHRRAPAAVSPAALDNYEPRVLPYGYGGSRTRVHVRPSVSRARTFVRTRAAPVPASAPRAPSPITGRSTTSGRTR